MGVFDLAVEERVVAVYAGATDKDAYEPPSLVPKERTLQVPPDRRRQALAGLYGQVRAVREGELSSATLEGVWDRLVRDYAEDWLLPLEILQLCEKGNGVPALAHQAHARLHQLAATRPALAQLIGQGLEALATA